MGRRMQSCGTFLRTLLRTPLLGAVHSYPTCTLRGLHYRRVAKLPPTWIFLGCSMVASFLFSWHVELTSDAGRQMEETGFKCDLKVVGSSTKALSAFKPLHTRARVMMSNTVPFRAPTGWIIILGCSMDKIVCWTVVCASWQAIF